MLDQALEKVIKDFWKNYLVEFNYHIEHKRENLSLRGAFFGKAHYALIRKGGERHYKIRGYREWFENSEDEKIRNPLFLFFDSILDSSFKFPENLKYRQIKHLSVNEWRKKSKSSTDYPYVPGDFIESQESNLRFGPSHLPSLSLKEYRKKMRYLSQGKRLSFHLEHESDNILHMLHQMMIMFV